MTKSSIEITDQAYLIKLQKTEFEYPLVRKWLSNLLNGSFQQGTTAVDDDELINKYSPELGERFDFLADK